MHQALLEPIFSGLRSRLLAAILLQPHKEWYMLELADYLEVSRSSLQRELASLAKSEILSSRNDGNRIYYKANVGCQILPELQSILLKTVGVLGLLEQELAIFSKIIDFAFVYGSFTQASELISSDVDVLIVGPINLRKLAPAIKSVEQKIARQVNPIIFSPTEFLEKLDSKNHFLTTVVESEKIYLIGADSELAKSFGRKYGQKTHGRIYSSSTH